MRALLDVDRWDRAGDDAQDAAIAEVARVIEPTFTWLRTERFTAPQHRIRSETCPACNGRGGEQPQSGSEYPDCDVCNNAHTIEHPFDSEPLSHRAGIFRHVATGEEFVLVPGRVEIAACLVGRKPLAGDIPSGLRTLTSAETRHACLRAGTFDLGWEAGKWTAHPFGLIATDPPAPRLAYTVPALAAQQIAAFHELVDELGPIRPTDVTGFLVRTGYGTADPPDHVYAIAFSRDGRWLATGHKREARVWDAANGRQLSRLVLATATDSWPVESLSFSPDHTRLVATSKEIVEIFDIATGESIARQGAGLPASCMEPHYNQYRAVAWLPANKLLLVEATQKDRRVFMTRIDPETGDRERQVDWAFDEYLYGVDLATTFDGSRAAVSLRRDGVLVIWDVDAWKPAMTVRVDRVSHLALGGDRLLVNGGDKVIAYTLSKDTFEEVGGTALSGVAVSPDGRYATWQSWDGIGVYDFATCVRRSFSKHASKPSAFSPDGLRVATHITWGTAAIWAI